MIKMRNVLPKMKLSVIAASLVVLGALSGNALAVDNNAANTMKVTPIRSDITADPGETKTIKITVTNPLDKKVSVKPIQNDFVAEDEKGTPALILDEKEYAPNHSLKRFLKPLESFEIGPKESKTVDVVIAVPENAEAGGYFGAIRFAPTNPDDGGQVNMSASVASIVLLRVSGDTPEKLELTDFQVRQNGKISTFLTSSDKVDMLVRFKNDSAVQLAPFGKISVKLGSKVVYEADFNTGSPQDVILPDSARRWEVPLDKIDGIGQYEVLATFTFGENNQTIEVSRKFWFVPMNILIGAGIALVVIVGLIVGLLLKKRYGKKSMSMGSKR